MSEKNKEIVSQWFSEYWGKGNSKIVDELGSDNLFFYYPLTGEKNGKEEVKECIVSLFKGFPDIDFQIIEPLIAEGDRVVGRWKGEGTQKGEFAGIPATNKRISFTGTTIYTVKDGKIVRELGEEDSLLVLQQLGVIPT